MVPIKKRSYCAQIGCTKYPNYNYRGTKKRLYCAEHKQKDMFDVAHKLCVMEGCNGRANYNYDKLPGKFCKFHSEEGMEHFHKQKTCAKEDCGIKPSFNYAGETVALFCRKHSKSDMIHLKKPTCAEITCQIFPTFNCKGETTGLYCKLHREPEMQSVVSKTCAEHACTKRPSYNYDMEIGGLYCRVHAKPNMISVTNKRCLSDGCRKQPTFNYRDQKKKLYCSTHKLPGMQDIHNKNCIAEGCSKFARYNNEGSKGRLYCYVHKSADMLPIGNGNRICCVKRCTNFPRYNLKEESTPEYCLLHKSNEMIDIVHKICSIPECQGRAYYGVPGHSPSRCFPHREIGMISRPSMKCLDEGCTELAMYGILKAKHCVEHREEDETNILERICKSCNLPNIVSVNNLCEYCDPEAFKSKYLEKQNLAIQYLKDNGLKITQIDKTIDAGVCGRERPDIMIVTNSCIIITEIDEHCHKYQECARICRCPVDENNRKVYHCKCDIGRMFDIAQSSGGLPVYFIRWNPDKYKTDGKMVSDKDRLRKLLEWNLKIIDFQEHKAFLSVIYLYYDYHKNRIEYQYESDAFIWQSVI